jgi:hypothetical protein
VSTPLLLCQRCGGPLVPLGDAAAAAEDMGVQALRASVALESRRLALPGCVAFALRDLARDLPRLADHLRCAAGRCTPAPPSLTPNQSFATATQHRDPA